MFIKGSAWIYNILPPKKELEVKRENEAHRLQSDMEKAAAQHKECKMEYDAGNKKRRRLELELSTKHESHSQEELVLEKQ